MKPFATPTPCPAGFTLLELLVTVLIASITLTIAIPSFTELAARIRLRGAAERLYADLQYARIEAIKRNRTVRVKFTLNGPLDWCYGLKLDGDCNCQKRSSADPGEFCEIGSARHITRSEAFPGIELAAANLGGLTPAALSFNPARGTVNAGSVRFKAAGSGEAKVIISALGRVRLCAPAGAQALRDYPPC